MSNIKSWLDAVIKNEIHAHNKVSNRGLAVCFNFIQIPDTETLIMTVTIMKNKVKKNSLDPKSFAKLMTCIEDSLSNIIWENGDNEPYEDEYFRNVKSQLSSQWYMCLCCHRVFFIPESGMWNAIRNLFNQKNVRVIKNNAIEEIAVYVNTDHYDFNAKFY